ncbi:integrase core domain-containing protein [Methylomonas sp. MO1]|uniref:integrase core domain-containing protein n=1 Tax=unclassified Methylomonas TaxID=2608980 RepID=UPI0012DEE22E|nr:MULTISPECIES: integrase core domain-containing protein [unclassified Methylomonas]MDT4290543.1 integrase core domain-containing protein [Methylomonas sp. MO1]
MNPNCRLASKRTCWGSVEVAFYLHAYDSVGQARASILDYFEWYNHKRPHSSLNRKKPHQAYTDLLPPVKMAA